MGNLRTWEFVNVGTRKVVNRGGSRLTINLPEALKDNVGLFKKKRYLASFWVHPTETDVIIRFKKIK